MTTWFTADTHFGHANIIKYCNRPFSDVDEMDEELIQRWNLRVKDRDTVYHLGDFCWKEPENYINRLHGNFFILNGSHDKVIKNIVLRDRIQTLTLPIKDEYGNPRVLVLCHYALRSWPESHYASWHLFGHHHGKLEPYGLSFDVGVDCWAFAPVSLEEVAAKMKTLKPIVDYRRKND